MRRRRGVAVVADVADVAAPEAELAFDSAEEEGGFTREEGESKNGSSGRNGEDGGGRGVRRIIHVEEKRESLTSEIFRERCRWWWEEAGDAEEAELGCEKLPMVQGERRGCEEEGNKRKLPLTQSLDECRVELLNGMRVRVGIGCSG